MFKLALRPQFAQTRTALPSAKPSQANRAASAVLFANVSTDSCAIGHLGLRSRHLHAGLR
jgi:hypothetical protein